MQNYSMTMNEFKIIFWWEWAHRFLGRLIGLGFLIPLIYFSFKIKLTKLLNLYSIFLLICFQGFIGWYMVSSGLIDRLDVSHFRLSIHLVIAFLILSLIIFPSDLTSFTSSLIFALAIFKHPFSTFPSY